MVIQKRHLLAALEMLTEGSDAPVAEAVRAEAAAVQKTARPWVMGPGIQGLGIARRVTAGKASKELALKVYVEKKLPKAKCKNPVPRTCRIGAIAGAIPTDIEAIGRVRLESNTSKVRPAIPGFSVFNVKGAPKNAGTFGCLVRRKNNTAGLYLLSNSHVLARSGLGSVGDGISQPGTRDGGTNPKDVIAKLSDWIPFQFTAATSPNLVDAAIAKVKSKKLVTSAIRLIGIPKGVGKALRIGMRVQKTGRTTDYTQGLIQDVNYRMALRYPKAGGGRGRVGFKDLVLCTRYTAGGDSGSAVLNMQGRVVGLHFAGSPSTSIFNKIAHVLELLGVDVVTNSI